MVAAEVSAFLSQANVSSDFLNSAFSNRVVVFAKQRPPFPEAAVCFWWELALCWRGLALSGLPTLPVFPWRCGRRSWSRLEPIQDYGISVGWNIIGEINAKPV